MAKGTRVTLTDGRTVQLTDAQVRAWRSIRTAGKLYAYNGISRATVAVLERHGLVTVEWKTVMVQTSNGYRGVWRQRPQLDWVARPSTAATK